MRKFILVIVLLNVVGLSFGQTGRIIAVDPPLELPEIPGLHHGGPMTLTNQKVFIRVAGLAAGSYVLAKYILKTETVGDFYQTRVSYGIGDYKHVIKESFGCERRVAPWFAVSLELSVQQWMDTFEWIDQSDKFGVGVGLQPYFKWYLFGKKRISPYIEYGTGFFQGFKKFPYDGTYYTFTHSSHLGVEYTSKAGAKFRLSYGQYHQSNNDWFDVNPGYNGNGINISYAWNIK